MLRHIPRSGPYPKQVIAVKQSPLTYCESETRTERVYHEVNGNPGVSTLGGRRRLVLNLAGSVSRDQLENLVKTIIDEYAKKA